MGHISGFCIAFLLCGPILAILFGISSGSLFLGFSKYNECPFEPLLPQALLGFGSMAMICSIIFLILILVPYFKVDDSGKYLFYFLYAAIILVVYSINAIILAFIIAFVLRTKHVKYQSEDPIDSESFCDASIYNFCNTFAVTVIALTSVFLIWLIGFQSVKFLQYLKKKFTVYKSNVS